MDSLQQLRPILVPGSVRHEMDEIYHLGSLSAGSKMYSIMYMCMIVHANMLCARERVKQVKVDSRQWGVCYGKYACCVGYECWPCFGHICEKGRLSWLFPHGDQNITSFCSNAHRGLFLLHVQG